MAARRADLLRPAPERSLRPRRRLCRQDPQGRQAWRSPGRTADEVVR